MTGTRETKYWKLLEESFSNSIQSREIAKERYYELSARDALNAYTTNFLQADKRTNWTEDTAPVQDASGSFVGIFKKNISITDITHAELIALLRRFSSLRTRQPKKQIQFHSSRAFEKIFLKCVFGDRNRIAEKKRKKLQEIIGRRIKQLSERFEWLLLNTIIVDFSATGFMLQIPNSVSVDLQNIVAHGGYVFSCGPLIYNSSDANTNSDEFMTRLNSFSDQNKIKSNKPVRLIPYSTEYFPEKMEGARESIRNGLEGIKLKLRKQFIGEDQLMNFLAKLSNLSNKRIFVPKYNDDGIEDYDKSKLCNNLSIFIVKDHLLRYSKTDRRLIQADEQNIICFAQILKNENPLHVLKESKFAWSAPITIPHTLSGALANLLVGRLQKNGISEEIIVADPFAGTGTMLIDFAQRLPDATFISLDRDPTSKYLISDNLQIFKGSILDVVRFFQAIDNYLKSNQIDVDSILATSDSEQYEGGKTASVLQNALHILITSLMRESGRGANEIRHKDIREYAQTPAFSKLLHENNAQNDEHYILRIALYFCWKAIYDNSYLLDEFDSKSLNSILKKEAAEFSDRCSAVRQKFPNKNKTSFTPSKDIFSIKPISSVLSNGDYSRVSDVNFKSIKTTSFDIQTSFNANKKLLAKPRCWIHHQVSDSVSTLIKYGENHPRSISAILTDPPYGFNKDEGDPYELEGIIFRLADAIALNLCVGGVVGLTLPASSKNGQHINFSLQQATFIRILFDRIASHDRRIRHDLSILPEPTTFPRPAFNWEAMQGVSRNIILFTVE